ncbi:hypothetical protein Curi_c11960 [Gottschalkia acidurici 9a]|uniref:N-formylglutamate amidohydrolase n=1 Tax=Gottschalkia acidurici (strain ATCC 7906 / DSM 604 / BCRC 14475 / CIP 104303 / KCTC 5404 / NCIMB 10678 / 9a) TaxID=1128398 RepID=K0AY88_GOTA9|nr:hypothetical protein [Gottschalkia acidurici]AFS78209.1 hypothetical protein Curi_c11960 [Gottschalkia acidurici 9a]
MSIFNLDYINRLEEEFSLNNYNGIKTENESFKVVDGSVPILISCAHSVNQIRRGGLKQREKYIGSVAKLLHEVKDVNVIYKYHNDGIDDNYVLETRYKYAIENIIKKKNIKMLIDIHGMVGSWSSRFRGYYIELGTDDGRNLLGNNYISNEAVNIFNKNGVDKVVVDKKFKASKNYTISKYTSMNCRIPTMQIEISGDFRDPNFNMYNFKKMIDSFKDIIDFVNRSL